MIIKIEKVELHTPENNQFYYPYGIELQVEKGFIMSSKAEHYDGMDRSLFTQKIRENEKVKSLIKKRTEK